MEDFRNCRIVNKEVIDDYTYYEVLTKNGNVLYFKEYRDGYVVQLHPDDYLMALCTGDKYYQVMYKKKAKKIIKKVALACVVAGLFVYSYNRIKNPSNNVKVRRINR